jgi:hypothetical protein
MRRVIGLVTCHPWALGVVVLMIGHLAFVMTRTYGTAGDWALIELRTSDVFSTHSPLTGAWSRYGWNHPGPLLFDVLAVPYALTGSSWRGLWLGAMVLNLAAIVGASRVLAPQSRALSIVFPLAALWAVSTGPSLLLTDPWNASVIVLPIVTMVAATTAVLLHDRRGLAVAAVVFVATSQTHAAYGLLLLPMMALVLVIGVRHWWRYTAMWVGAGAALCLPLLVDTLIHWPGNLVEAFRFTATSDEPARGFGAAVRVLGRATSLSSIIRPQLPSFVSIVDRPAWGAAPGMGLVAIAASLVVAHRRGWTAHQHALTAVALLWLGGFVMVARTRGPLLIWLLGWVAAACAITWALVALVIVRWWAERVSFDTERVMPAAAGAVGLCLAMVNVAGSVGEGYPFHELHPVVIQFADDAATSMTTPMAIDMSGDEYVAGGVQSGLIVRLEAMDLRPLARPDQALQMGARRTASSLDEPHLLVRVETTDQPPTDATQVSVWDPLSHTDRAEADELSATLAAVLIAAGMDDRLPLLDNEQASLATYDGPPALVEQQAAFDRLADLRRAGPRIVLYLIAGAAAADD